MGCMVYGLECIWELVWVSMTINIVTDMLTGV
jgi:hypothetical protein